MRSLYSEGISTVIMKKKPEEANKSGHRNLHAIKGGDIFYR
jgi:hypothetical protein